MTPGGCHWNMNMNILDSNWNVQDVLLRVVKMTFYRRVDIPINMEMDVIHTSNAHDHGIRNGYSNWNANACENAQSIFESDYAMSMSDANTNIDVNVDASDASWWIRHVGWSTSLILAVVLHLFLRHQHHRKRQSHDHEWHDYNDWRNLAVLTAYLTALDAVCTDLLQFSQFLSLPFSISTSTSPCTYYCGNFGIILLHGAWMDAQHNNNGKGGKGKAALDILEKMIQVTMMRGAQSGGVVTYKSSKKMIKGDGDGDNSGSGNKSNSIAHSMVAKRTRVVKSKRGDLSKLLRRKMESEIMSTSSILPSKNKRIPDPNAHRRVQFFAGHTRFATSSMASLDGTHPHQWTCDVYKVYNMEEESNGEPSLGSSILLHLSSTLLRRNSHHHITRSISKPTRMRVENYITHNGDFEFFRWPNGTGKIYDVETISHWLEYATSTPAKTAVDSASIAGMIDLIRCQGSFHLSVRYVICLLLPTSGIDEDVGDTVLPSKADYDSMADLFEAALLEFQTESPLSLERVGADSSHRTALAQRVTDKLTNGSASAAGYSAAFAPFIRSEEDGASPFHFCQKVINAFWDNDLFFSVKQFMTFATGSFGLSVSSSLDAHRQLCLASRGQTISVAFYPQKRIVLFGSEQAAVKAGMNVEFPGDAIGGDMDKSHLDVDNDVLRLDLNDLGGEICLLDWGGRSGSDGHALSHPNRHIQPQSTMNDHVDVYLLQESQSFGSKNESNQDTLLYHRMTKLTRNPLITPLKEDAEDTILQDIRDIPKLCKDIQDDWKVHTRRERSGSESAALPFSLNRLTAWNLGRCLKQRLNAYVDNTLTPSPNRVDILLTGCEVSLWLAEQFASDLQKSFPKLRIVAISSNKLLGLFGQEDINVPTVGFTTSSRTLNYDDAIVLIVSHSGGTFSPLGCSSLFQSTTRNIFVVTSEWDTQIGKQLRMLDQQEEGMQNDGSGGNSRIHMGLLFNSRIFTTGVGVRPAEPCSVSVAATHQLLTNIFEFVSVVILSESKYCDCTGAIITQRDLEILERCNKDNVYALEDITGTGHDGTPYPENYSTKENELRHAGDIWAEHVLENAKAYCMSFLYIFGTVISGYPLFSGIASGAGLKLGINSASSGIMYFLKVLDAMIYFFLPQINIILLRIIQRRPLRHRMVGRTVVIGDIPWVAQAGEAFLSKIFACSYSIAGINVHSANPSDHLVHRMTHRVMRGTLLICGRPDGRLSALTAMENAVVLSINQASSIQSIGSSCESVTIGHNRFKLPLTARGIFLERHRPLFLCEHLLKSRDVQPDIMNTSRHRRHYNIVALEEQSLAGDSTAMDASNRSGTLLDEALGRSVTSNFSTNMVRRNTYGNSSALSASSNAVNTYHHSVRRSSYFRREKTLSSAALLGIYKTLENDTIQQLEDERLMDCSSNGVTIDTVLEAAIHEKKWSDNAWQLFKTMDKDNDKRLSLDEFVNGLTTLNSSRSKEDVTNLFLQFDKANVGSISFDQFHRLMTMNSIQIDEILKPTIRDSRGLIQVQPSRERFFGEGLLERHHTTTNTNANVRAASGTSNATGNDNGNRKRSSNTATTSTADISFGIGATKSQTFAQELYESRIASLQRFVSMTVMFHQMGDRVEKFFSRNTFGLLGYRKDRTHSIMRIATTASPISGADVRDRKRALYLMKRIHHSVHVISNAWLAYKKGKDNREEKKMEYWMD